MPKSKLIVLTIKGLSYSSECLMTCWLLILLYFIHHNDRKVQHGRLFILEVWKYSSVITIAKCDETVRDKYPLLFYCQKASIVLLAYTKG